MRIILKNGKVLTPFRLIENGGVITEGEKITGVFEGNYENINCEDKIIDVEGNFISPGFIDIHTHGGGNHDFLDGTPEAIIEGCKAHMIHGTTSIVPTISSSKVDELMDSINNFRQAKIRARNSPNLLGLHLEGPYFSLEQRGAQDPRHIRNPNREEYMSILDASNEICRWTLAPELDGALEMGMELRKRGIVASIGHSNATYDQVLKALEYGFNHVTHFYSGTSMVRRINAYRFSGIVETAYLMNEMTVEIIADGKHLPSSLLKLVYKIKGSDKVCLVTDSIRAAGLTDIKNTLAGSLKNGQEVIIEDGVAKLSDRSSFAGSIATADRLVRTMVELADVPLLEAVKMLTYTPAKIMGIEKHKGTLSPGKDADIIVFNDDITVSVVIVKGNVYVNKQY